MLVTLEAIPQLHVMPVASSLEVEAVAELAVPPTITHVVTAARAVVALLMVHRARHRYVVAIK